jgi:hypothetical protein
VNSKRGEIAPLDPTLNVALTFPPLG